MPFDPRRNARDSSLTNTDYHPLRARGQFDLGTSTGTTNLVRSISVSDDFPHFEFIRTPVTLQVQAARAVMDLGMNSCTCRKPLSGVF